MNYNQGTRLGGVEIKSHFTHSFHGGNCEAIIDEAWAGWWPKFIKRWKFKNQDKLPVYNWGLWNSRDSYVFAFQTGALISSLWLIHETDISSQ